MIFLGRGNTIDWQLQADGAAVDLASVTRMVLQLDGQTLDSDTQGNGQGNTFYWTSGTPGSGEPNLYLRPGPAAETAGVSTGNHNLRLIVYDPDHPEGLVWISSEPVTVV
jgi:hypothetical protein